MERSSTTLIYMRIYSAGILLECQMAAKVMSSFGPTRSKVFGRVLKKGIVHVTCAALFSPCLQLLRNFENESSLKPPSFRLFSWLRTIIQGNSAVEYWLKSCSGHLKPSLFESIKPPHRERKTFEGENDCRIIWSN